MDCTSRIEFVVSKSGIAMFVTQRKSTNGSTHHAITAHFFTSVPMQIGHGCPVGTAAPTKALR
jgi:hypothetical protein